MRAIILAGGAGVRLRPYTTTLPKPLLPLGGDRAILEVVLDQLAAAGVTRVTLAVNHMASLITAFFGDGARWGLAIDHVIEDEPLGTAGPLARITDLPDDFLVMNGDVLSELDYRAFFASHLAAGNDLTLAVCRRETPLAFGVVTYDAAHRLVDLVEKPVLAHDINMGVYAMRRTVIERIPRGAPCGLDVIVRDLMRAGAPVGVVPFAGFWLDIGTPADYDYANQHWPELGPRLDRVR